MKQRKELNIQIGNRVREARTAMHYTQAQLAEILDISIPFLSDIERGVVGVSVETLLKICFTLHVSTDWLLKGEKTNLSNTVLLEKLKGVSPEHLRTIDEIIDRLLLLIADDNIQ